MTWRIFILMIALVFLFLAAIKIPEPARISFGWLGLFLFGAAQLMPPLI